MQGRANQPRDLVWNLEDFSSPDLAMKFFDLFENRFMIYSSSVQKAYGEYSTQLTGPDGHRRLVVLPKFDHFDSIANRIRPEAVVETSIYIYPRHEGGKTYLTISGINQADQAVTRLPFRQGLRALKMGFFEDGNVLPVLMLGDLREFPEKKLPYLKLHTVRTDQLRELSEFERHDLAKGTWLNISKFIA